MLSSKCKKAACTYRTHATADLHHFKRQVYYQSICDFKGPLPAIGGQDAPNKWRSNQRQFTKASLYDDIWDFVSRLLRTLHWGVRIVGGMLLLIHYYL